MQHSGDVALRFRSSRLDMRFGHPQSDLFPLFVKRSGPGVALGWMPSVGRALYLLWRGCLRPLLC